MSAFPVQVFYISETWCGGSLKYLEDLKTVYGAYGIIFHRIGSKTAAREVSHLFRDNDILVFQYILNSDFTFDDVRDLVKRQKLRLVIPIHDKYFLNDDPETDYRYSPSLHFYEAAAIPTDKLELLGMAQHIIFPSQFIHDVFLSYINFTSMVMVPHIERHIQCSLRIPSVNQTYNVGIITSPTYYKGIDILEELFLCTSYKMKNVQFYFYANYDNSKFPAVVVRGGYAEDDIYEHLKVDKIHGLLFLNRYPETYSYALTKGLNSNLPILYTKMGAIAERVENKNDKKFIPTDNSDVRSDFFRLLDYIESHERGDVKMDLQRNAPSLLPNDQYVIPKFYDRLFLERRA